MAGVGDPRFLKCQPLGAFKARGGLHAPFQRGPGAGAGTGFGLPSPGRAGLGQGLCSCRRGSGPVALVALGARERVWGPLSTETQAICLLSSPSRRWCAWPASVTRGSPGASARACDAGLGASDCLQMDVSWLTDQHRWPAARRDTGLSPQPTSQPQRCSQWHRAPRPYAVGSGCSSPETPRLTEGVAGPGAASPFLWGPGEAGSSESA